jgi:2-dehydropantoate 2-reductase
MKIAIIGIGGVGGYYGGKLSTHYGDHNDLEVTFIARGEHLKEIQKEGLKLITNEGTFIAKPDKATDNPANCGIFDLVLFCVKSYDLDHGAKLLYENISEKTVVISLLNGVDNHDRLVSVLPNAHILNGCVYISAYIEKPGTVRQVSGSCKLFFGDEYGKFDDRFKIDKIFIDATIKAEYRKDINDIVWEKYVFISPLASVTAFQSKTFGEIMDDAESKKLLEGLLKEVELVGRAQGANLPNNICQRSLDKISLFPYDTKSSMQVDFEKNRKTEIETFTGYIVKTAKDYGLEAPLHEMIYSSLLNSVHP